MNQINNRTPRALPPGTILPHNYIIGQVLGEGGFGITYSCTLQHSEEHFAVKEYFPNNIAYRMTDCQTIVPCADQAGDFEKGKRHFRTEASILLEFQYLQHIVGVKDILEENGTIYLVMEYVDGITLKQYIEENEPLPFDELASLITPVMRDLIRIHKKGLLHRDISPDNLMLGTDNQLHLIDFGSADFETGPEQQMVTIILKSGFAPPEQYLSDGKLGPWTDVYGLCATMYYALTGFAPLESVRRLQKDDMLPLSDHAQIRSWQAEVIEKGLCLHAAERYQSMESLYQAIIIPPIEISSERKEKLASIKYNKTIMPLKRSSDGILFSDAQHIGYDKKGNKSTHENTVKSIHLLYRLGLIIVVFLLVYAGIGFSGISLPLWPDNWTIAFLDDDSQEDAIPENPSRDITGQDTSEQNVKSDDNATRTTSEQNVNSDDNTNSSKSSTTEDKQSSPSTEAKTPSISGTSDKGSTTAENAGSETSGTKTKHKATEKNTNQSKDIFSPLLDDEYDTFTD